MKKIALAILLFLSIIGLIFLSGPKIPVEPFEESLPKISLQEIYHKIEAEKDIENLIEGCEAELIWANKEGEKTPYSIVYLHGYTACKEEGDSLHKSIAKTFGMNLYLPRLIEHGLVSDSIFKNLTPNNYYSSALEALAVGKLIGEKVILMGTSTGCTFAVDFAAKYPDLVHSLIFYSPNIDIYDKKSNLLTLPWGKQISRIFHGGTHNTGNYIPHEEGKRWQRSYRLEGQIALRAILNEIMTENTFSKIDQPLYLAYYYKNENEHDKVVSIPAMKSFFNGVSTPEIQKRIKAFDAPENHVLINKQEVKAYQKIESDLFNFFTETMGFEPMVVDSLQLEDNLIE
jgi:pimeloyl-ACP methyl ester carboxylesterase